MATRRWIARPSEAAMVLAAVGGAILIAVAFQLVSLDGGRPSRPGTADPLPLFGQDQLAVNDGHDEGGPSMVVATPGQIDHTVGESVPVKDLQDALRYDARIQLVNDMVLAVFTTFFGVTLNRRFHPAGSHDGRRPRRASKR